MLYFQLLNNYFGYNFDISLHPYPHPYQEDGSETGNEDTWHHMIHIYEYCMDNVVCFKNVIKYYIFSYLHMVGVYREKRDESKKYQFPFISKFDEIERYTDAIYIFDIDDTIFYYEDLRGDWWRETVKYNLEHGMNDLNAKYMALRKWERAIYHQPFVGVKGIDTERMNDLITFINNSDGVFHFITSRGSNHSNLTYSHLSRFVKHNIDGKIRFADGKNKGHVLRQLLNSNKIENRQYNKIVFIDDIQKNLIDIKNEFPEAECYQMVLF